MFFLKWKRRLAGMVRFSWAGGLLAMFLAVLPALAEDDMPEASDSPTVPSADAKTTADRLNDAFELLADGKREAAEQQADIVRADWRDQYGSGEEARRNWEVWLSDFEKLKNRPPPDIAEYVAAWQKVIMTAARVSKMRARKLPHGRTLAEAEEVCCTQEELLDRCLGGKSYYSVLCHTSLGHVHGCRREWSAAEESFERALELLLADFPDDRSGIAATRQWLAWILMEQGKDFPRQKEYLEAALEYAESAQDEEARYWPPRLKTLLAEAAYRSGESAEANLLFAKLRLQLPREHEEGGKDLHMLWCRAWCERHEARLLIEEERYDEALAAIYAARKALSDGGKKAELSAGLTHQELCCLAAKAVDAGGGEDVAQVKSEHVNPPQAEIPIANAIAKHAARLRGEPYKPIVVQPTDRAWLIPSWTSMVKTVCLRNWEGVFCLGAWVSLDEDEPTSQSPSEKTTAGNAEVAVAAESKINVEACLRLGEFDKVRRWASELRNQAEGVLGRDHVIVKASSEAIHVMDVIEGLPKEDQQAFCRTYNMLQGAIGKLRAAEQSAFASFTEINVAMDRLRVASEQFAAFPEPLKRFQANCDIGLAEAHILLRNWSEAELLLSHICEREGDSMLFASSFWARPGLSYVLLLQGKDEERIKELMEAQNAFVRTIGDHSFCGVKPKLVYLMKAEAAVAFGDRDEAERVYEKLRTLVDEDEPGAKHWLSFYDRHRARRLLEDDDLIGACELIEDVYAKMITLGKGSYFHGPEIEKTLRLRAEIYERLGRNNEAKADIAYADDIARHAERVRGMCAADAEQRGKWANAKVDIPGLPTEESDDKECAKKETTGLEEWLRTGKGEYATGQSLFSKRR